MKKQLMCAVLAVGSAASFGFSKDNDRADHKGPNDQNHNPAVLAAATETRRDIRAKTADQALKEYYGPSAQIRVVRTYEVNNVKIHTFDITMSGAVSQATVTDDGHLITTGRAVQMANLPPAVQQTAELFKAPATSITVEETHGYFVIAKGSTNQTFVIAMDPAGRIRNIVAPEQLHEDAKTTQEKVSGAPVQEVEKHVMQHFPGVQIQGVSGAMHDPGYYMAGFKNANGNGWAILNAQGDLTEWRMPVPRGELPLEVQKALTDDLKGDRIVDFERGSERLYKVTQMVGGEETTLLIRPNGNVEWMSARALHAGPAAKK